MRVARHAVIVVYTERVTNSNAKTVTYDFHRLMDAATKIKRSNGGLGDAIIKHLGKPAGAEKAQPAMAGA
jgi:hypothetical protein